MSVKGIVLAGGAGTRLWPITQAVVKQLLPVYDKPMIYYPMTTLMQAGVNEILIISQSANRPLYQALFEDGSGLGISVYYADQDHPNGIAEALVIAHEVQFVEDKDTIVLILGDNLFAGSNELIRKEVQALKHFSYPRATIFVTEVNDPQRYGVLYMDENGTPTNLIEKPASAVSRWAVTGLYIYDSGAIQRVMAQSPSMRGELEITDLNQTYLEQGLLFYCKLERGTAWLDTGTPEALLQAAQYVQTIQERHGIMLGSPEMAAYEQKWVTARSLEHRILGYNNAYGEYLRGLILR